MIETGIFLLIFCPLVVIMLAMRQQQEMLAHRRFLKTRIGGNVPLTTQLKKQSVEILSKLSEQLMEQFSAQSFLKKLIQDVEFSGVHTNGKQYIFWRLFMPACLVIGFILIQLFLFAVLPLLYVVFNFLKVVLVKNKKLNQSLLQLPDLISMISNSIKAGNSLFTCFAFVAEEMPYPTRSYFEQLHTELQYGISFKQASAKMLRPLSGIPEYCMFISAVNIQRESGGNLSEVLDILSTTIRERLKMKSKIDALTGQSRLTGYIIGAAPTALLVFLCIFNYKFVEPLFTYPMGKIMLSVAIVMQIIGFYVIKKIVDIRV